MARFGSRAKGKVAEREIAKLLQAWWGQYEVGCEFASTPLSGGWNKASIRAGMKLSGDLCTTAQQFPYVVEVKRREKWDLLNVLQGRKSPVWTWWAQTQKSAAEMHGRPILFFRKNREKWLFLARASDVPIAVLEHGDLVSHEGDDLLVVGLLDDLLKASPPWCL